MNIIVDVLFKLLGKTAQKHGIANGPLRSAKQTIAGCSNTSLNIVLTSSLCRTSAYQQADV